MRTGDFGVITHPRLPIMNYQSPVTALQQKEMRHAKHVTPQVSKKSAEKHSPVKTRYGNYQKDFKMAKTNMTKMLQGKLGMMREQMGTLRTGKKKSIKVNQMETQIYKQISEMKNIMSKLSGRLHIV